MRKLPLATLGAATALGLLAAAAQAEPVKLSLAQMDELTAGEATATASASASSSADASASVGPEGGNAATKSACSYGNSTSTKLA